MTVESEQLRVVSEAAVAGRARAHGRRRAAHDRWKRGASAVPPTARACERAIFDRLRPVHLLWRSIPAMSRFTRDGGAPSRYCARRIGTAARPSVRTVGCWNEAADRAVHEVLADVLQPRRLAAALDLVLQQSRRWRRPAGGSRANCNGSKSELVNLSETVRAGGGVPAILNALARRDDERCRLLADLATLEHGRD